MSGWLTTRHIGVDTFANILIQQKPAAIPWMSRLLHEHEIKAVLELGTGSGAMTLLFGLHCPDKVVTADNKNILSLQTSALFRKLGITEFVIDIYENNNMRYLIDYISSKCACFENIHILVFCDNGNKHKDFELSRPYLKPGSLIVVDDCPEEFKPDTVDATGLKRLYKDELLADCRWSAWKITDNLNNEEDEKT